MNFSSSTGDAGSTFTDSRDGNTYPLVNIGSQTWMGKNLAWLPAVSPSSAGSDTDSYYYVYGYEGSTVASAKATANYTTYGVLYNLPAAMTACPTGWHLPSDAEWTILTDYLGSSSGTKMKATSGWNFNGNGDNSSGFTALPGGLSYSGGFSNLGLGAYFWSASEGGTSTAWYRYLGYGYDGVYRFNYYRYGGFSVRCLQN
jgi:uncharacterized protein (TIGR02145 family)